MLIGNYSVLSKDPGRSIGGGAIGLGMNRGDFNKTSMERGAFTQEDWDQKSGKADGYGVPYSWMMPIQSGAMTARGNISGSSSATISMAAGINGQATLTGAGDMAGIGALIVSMVAALSGSGTVAANGVGILNLVAAISGSGSISATMRAVASFTASISGSGTASAVPYATGSMASSIVVTGDMLTTANVGEAVWAAIASLNNVAGTMGEKLNDAGSASNPWTEALPGAYVEGTAGYIVGNILDLIGERLVEGGLSQDEVSRIMLAALAGKREGLGSNTEKYMAQNGTTPRITLIGFDSNGNGTPVVDGS